MSKKEMESKIEALKEWEALLSDAQQQVESLKDEIKAEMDAQGVEELEAGKFIVRWTSVLTQRFDSTSFKRALPELYKQYTKQSASRRFSIA